MRDSSRRLATLLFFIWTWPVAAQSEDASANLVLACDRAAASPSDDNRPAGIAGVPSGKLDPQYAIPACQAAAAAAPDEPRLMFELGRAQTAAKDYAAARPQFSRASDLGYAAARASLGAFYANGIGGLSRDDREALRLFQLAAEQHNAVGESNLGFFHLTGRVGLPKDESEAARLFKLAADKGEAGAQFDLGRLYEQGGGHLPQDDPVQLGLVASLARPGRQRDRHQFFRWGGAGQAAGTPS
jgi:TPR repeat protein